MRSLLGLIVLPLLLAAALLFLLTDAQPKQTRAFQVGWADLERGRALVATFGLRRLKEGQTRKLVLTESDLDQGVNYLAHHVSQRLSRSKATGSARAWIDQSRLYVEASMPLPGLHRYVNLTLALDSMDNTLKPAQLRIGKLPLPAQLTVDLVLWGLAHFPPNLSYIAELTAARSMLNSVQISGQTVVVYFTWHRAALAQVMSGRDAKNTALMAYQTRLRQSDSLNFAVLLGEVFTLAQQRSAQNDPLIENRAALSSLAELVLGGQFLAPLLAQSSQKLRGPRKGITLAGREDFSQHFALSAFLAATGGEDFSDMAGLYKELKDSQGGSGFSFTDIAADRAGSRLGEACTHTRASALDMQRRLAGVRTATVFFPAVNDLPELMAQTEFRRRFGGVGHPAYRKMIEQVETRIAALPAYQH